LLELLLVIAILSILFSIAAAFFDRWAKDSVDRQVGREMQRLQNAAEAFVELNINDVRANFVPVVGDVAEIPVDELRDRAFLPSGFNAFNSYRQQMRVFVRYATSTSARGDVFEIITVSDDVGGSERKIPDRRLFNAATSGQKSVGLISNLSISPTCCNGTIQSTNGEWSVPLATISTLYTTTPDANGGYMAAYGRIFTDDILTGNYLYRFEIPEIANSNRMEVNLDIDNNDIENIGVLIADTVTSDSARIRGNSYSRLPGTYSFISDDQMSIDNNLQVNAGPDDQNGTVTIVGDNGVAVDFIVNGDLAVLNATTGFGSINADRLVAQQLDVAQESNFGNVNNTGANVTAGNIYANTGGYNQRIQVDNDMQASNISGVRDMSASNMASSQISVNATLSTPGDMQIDNNMNVNNNLITNQRVLGTDQVTIGTLNRPCGSDCP